MSLSRSNTIQHSLTRQVVRMNSTITSIDKLLRRYDQLKIIIQIIDDAITEGLEQRIPGLNIIDNSEKNESSTRGYSFSFNQGNKNIGKITFYLSSKLDDFDLENFKEKAEINMEVQPEESDKEIYTELNDSLSQDPDTILHATLGWINGSRDYPAFASFLFIKMFSVILLKILNKLETDTELLKKNIEDMRFLITLDNDADRKNPNIPNPIYKYNLLTRPVLESDGTLCDSQEIAFGKFSYILKGIIINMRRINNNPSYTGLMREVLEKLYEKLNISPTTTHSVENIIESQMNYTIDEKKRVNREENALRRSSRLVKTKGGTKRRKKRHTKRKIVKKKKLRKTRQLQ